MVKFDSEFAIFGTFAAKISDEISTGDSIIENTNNACIKLYGDLRGKTIFEVMSEICKTKQEASTFLEKLNSKGMVSFEGILNKKYIKYHSRIIDCRDKISCSYNKFIQVGITDMSESVLLKNLLYGTSEALKRAAKAADEDTGAHVERINKYSELLATLAYCDNKFIQKISKFAQLHDIGKINVANIIKLPRKLTDEEFNIIKKHTIYGGEIVKNLTGLQMAFDIAIDHHERWDGSGYPYGKIGENISLEGRIVAIVDVFDALVSKRAYKEAFSYDKTYNIIKFGDGRVMPNHFDPKLLNIFLLHYDEFTALHKKLKK